MVDDLLNPHYGSILKGMSSTEGINASVSMMLIWDDVEAFCRMLVRQKVFAVYFATYNHKISEQSIAYLQSHGVEVFFSWNNFIIDIDSLMLKTVQYLVDLGHTKIAYLSGLPLSDPMNERYTAFINALETCRIPVRRDLILDGVYPYYTDAKSGYWVMKSYLNSGPVDDPQAGAAFGYTSHTEPVSMDFVHKWAGVLEELSTRYGRRIRGWWLDGCHPCIGYDAEKCGIYAEAIRRGNPDAIISFNASVVENVESFSSCDDFTAGERNWFDDMPKGRFLGDTQWHLLSFLGYDARDFQVHAGWAQPNCKYSPEYIHDFVAAAVARDGVVSVDVFMDRYGNIAPKHMEVLNALRDIREA